MSFDWIGYLFVAEWLKDAGSTINLNAVVGLPPDEALFRASVSRAYYAAFHHAVLRIESKIGYQKEYHSPQCHGAVCNYFARKVGASKQIHTLLFSLMKIRCVADYQATATFNQADALKAVLNAKKIINLLKLV